MLKSPVTNAIIFTIGGFIWFLNFALYSYALSLYVALLFIVGASIYWASALNKWRP